MDRLHVELRSKIKENHLELLLLSIVFDEDFFQFMVDALHAAGHPGDGGLWHRDVGQRHLS